jgi:hypothetical protein
MRIGSIAPRASGGFIAGTEHGFAEVDLGEGRFEVFCNPEEDRPDNRFNDGKVDADGRFSKQKRRLGKPGGVFFTNWSGIRHAGAACGRPAGCRARPRAAAT